MRAAGESIVGRRDNNEDVYAVRPDLGLYLVADGMGGHEGGEVASQLAAEAVTWVFQNANVDEATIPDDSDERFYESPEEEARRISTQLEIAYRRAHSMLSEHAQGELKDMGTTLSTIWIGDDSGVVAHLGDSRIYRLRDGQLQQLTDDHSLAWMMHQQGKGDLLRTLPPEYAAVVTRCLSIETDPIPDLLRVDVHPNDIFLLCSDGLSDVLRTEQIAEVLRSHEDPNEASHALVKAAYRAGSYDNITCVVIHANTH